MNSLKRQAKARKISAVAGIPPQATVGEVVPVEPAAAPAQGKKRGRPTKAPRSEARTSSGSPVSNFTYARMMRVS